MDIQVIFSGFEYNPFTDASGAAVVTDSGDELAILEFGETFELDFE